MFSPLFRVSHYKNTIYIQVYVYCIWFDLPAKTDAFVGLSKDLAASKGRAWIRSVDLWEVSALCDITEGHFSRTGWTQSS